MLVLSLDIVFGNIESLVFLLGRKRDRLSIVADILEVANSGSSKTRIMFRANLSFSLLEKYLDVVVRSGFVEVQDGKYMLTERGREFLVRFRKIQGRFASAQKLAETLGDERDKLGFMCNGDEGHCDV